MTDKMEQCKWSWLSSMGEQSLWVRRASNRWDSLDWGRAPGRTHTGSPGWDGIQQGGREEQWGLPSDARNCLAWSPRRRDNSGVTEQGEVLVWEDGQQSGTRCRVRPSRMSSWGGSWGNGGLTKYTEDNGSRVSVRDKSYKDEKGAN